MTLYVDEQTLEILSLPTLLKRNNTSVGKGQEPSAEMLTAWGVAALDESATGDVATNTATFNESTQTYQRVYTAYTQEQIDAQAKMTGVEFEGVMCSATAQDMWGLASIKDWVRAGNSTSFEFQNGNTLTLTPANVDAFEATWTPFRASFF